MARVRVSLITSDILFYIYPSLLPLSRYIITRVAPHCVNTLRILHAAYDATKRTCPLINTPSVR